MTKESKRLKKSLKQFKKKKVDFGYYVKDFYLEHGLAMISCQVNQFSDIINRYSVKNYEWLNPRFVQYIDENANYIPTEYPIVLEICGGNFSTKERDIITQTISDYYALKLGDQQLAVKAVRSKILYLILLGAIFSVVYTISGGFLALVREIILIFFWIWFWQLGEEVAFNRRKAKQKKTDAAQLAYIKVVFKDKFVDQPLHEHEEELLLAEIFSDDDEYES